MDLDARTISAWQRNLTESGSRNGKPLSSSVVRQARMALCSTLDMAIKWGLIERNPVRLTATLRNNSRKVSTSQAEADRILECFKGTRHESFIILLLGTGLRVSEALGLRWSDCTIVDDRVARLRVSCQLTYEFTGGTRGKHVLADPKSASGVRSIPVPVIVSEALLRQRAWQAQCQQECTEANPWNNEWGLVFTGETGKPLHNQSVRRSCKSTMARAGLGDVHLHDLRHYCASMLVSQGVHPRVIMGVLGHSSITITMNLYSHLMDSVDQEAASAMDRALGATDRTAGK